MSGDLLELGAPSGHAHRRAPQRSTQPYPLDLVVGPTASSFSATEAVLDFFDASSPDSVLNPLWTAHRSHTHLEHTDR